MTLRLYVTRHGETEANVQNLLQGLSDTPLTSKGALQAQQLGSRLAHELISVVFSSDLPRTVRTTKIMMEEIGATGVVPPVIYTKRLRERAWGIYEQYSVSEFNARRDSKLIDLTSSGIESLDTLEARVRNFLGDLIRDYSQTRLLIASHQAVCRMITKVCLDLPSSEWPSIKHDNATLSVFDGVGKCATATALNCSAHLLLR